MLRRRWPKCPDCGEKMKRTHYREGDGVEFKCPLCGKKFKDTTIPLGSEEEGK